MKRTRCILALLLCLALLSVAGCGRKNNYADVGKNGKDVFFRLVDLDGQTETTMDYEAGDTLEASVEELYGNVHLIVTPYVEPAEPETAEGQEAGGEEAAGGETAESEAPAPILDVTFPGEAKQVQIEESGTYTVTIICSKRTSGTVFLKAPEAKAEEEAPAEGESPAEGEAPEAD